MQARSIITLLTDFGEQDGYVGAMKGVILNEAPAASIIDISHNIPAQDIESAAWILPHYCFCYPRGTVHLAVVDPGVGTTREGLVAELDGCIFIGPDNGLFTWVYEQAEDRAVYTINSGVQRPGDCSATFHGRDIFAYVAALLISGKVRLDQIATRTDAMVKGPWGAAEPQGNKILGRIVHVDHFGNLITNIEKSMIDAIRGRSFLIRAGAETLNHVCRTYGVEEQGGLIALWNSMNLLELAVVGGAALDRTGLKRGDGVSIEIE